jgi:hypothetical protein
MSGAEFFDGRDYYLPDAGTNLGCGGIAWAGRSEVRRGEPKSRPPRPDEVGDMRYVASTEPLFLLSAVPGSIVLRESDVTGKRGWNAEAPRCQSDQALHDQGDAGGYHRRLTGSGCITGTLQVFFPAIGWTATCFVQDRVMSRKAVDTPRPRCSWAPGDRPNPVRVLRRETVWHRWGRRDCNSTNPHGRRPDASWQGESTRFPTRGRDSSARDEKAGVGSGSGHLAEGPLEPLVISEIEKQRIFARRRT